MLYCESLTIATLSTKGGIFFLTFLHHQPYMINIIIINTPILYISTLSYDIYLSGTICYEKTTSMIHKPENSVSDC